MYSKYGVFQARKTKIGKCMTEGTKPTPILLKFGMWFLLACIIGEYMAIVQLKNFWFCKHPNTLIFYCVLAVGASYTEKEMWSFEISFHY